jgi:drug/metabolite transporter (DMT)-like permease
MSSLFDTVGGLPVHALVVHAVVVLVPIGALGAILIVLRRSLSRRYASLVVIALAIGAGGAVVAKQSGEQLAKLVAPPPTHVDLGSVMPLIAIGLFLIVMVFWLFDRGIPMNRPRPTWLKVFGVVVILAALFATFWVVQVGHTGSEGVWTTILR